MSQPEFDFIGAINMNLPVSGKAPRQRHASASGAITAAKGRPELALQYLALLKAAGPLSDHAAAKALGREISSINSTRNGLGPLVVDSGTYEETAFRTKRTKWRAA